MAMIALTSASGSPGVTTTAVGLALSWPRPVLVIEADPTGGSAILAGFLRGASINDASLIDLALSPLAVNEALRDLVRPLGGAASFVAGTRTHIQARALARVWEPLAGALMGLDTQGQDVIVDAGRLGLLDSPHALLEAADLTLIVTRTHIPALLAAQSWAEHAKNPASGWRHPGLLLVGEGHPYGAREVSAALGLPVVAVLPDAVESAAVYHRGSPPPRLFATGVYSRALTATALELHRTALRNHRELVEAQR